MRHAARGARGRPPIDATGGSSAAVEPLTAAQPLALDIGEHGATTTRHESFAQRSPRGVRGGLYRRGRHRVHRLAADAGETAHQITGAANCNRRKKPQRQSSPEMIHELDSLTSGSSGPFSRAGRSSAVRPSYSTVCRRDAEARPPVRGDE